MSNSPEAQAPELPDEQSHDEPALYTAYLSWWLFLPRLALAAVLASGGLWALLNAEGMLRSYLPWLGLVGLVLAAAVVLIKQSVTVPVTAHHVQVRKALLSLSTVTLNLHRIESVDVSQTLVQRLAGFGDVVIRGVGNEDVVLNGISQPDRLKEAVLAVRAPDTF